MDNILNAIAEERNKQIQNGQYLLKDRYTFSNNMIANLAAFYASKNNLYNFNLEYEYSKKNLFSRKEQLTIAGALIVAEIQRLEFLECELYCFVKSL